MYEIICPHCGKAFNIDKVGYADFGVSTCQIKG